eukprot:scaffold96327_cov32-Attheya_sp.AAC.3
MASRLASRKRSVGRAAASTTNQNMTSRTTTGKTTVLPTTTRPNITVPVPPSVVATTNDSVSEMGTGASAVYLNQQRSNELLLTNDQLLGIVVSKTVGLELFHRVKFVTSPNELNWGQPIHRWIYQKVHFSGDKSFKDFWAKHCRCVRLTLNKKEAM